MYSLVCYVPESHLDAVKAALFKAGAGCYKDYDSCCWCTLGQGQFRPLEGSTPYLGQQGQVEHVSEYRIETICEKHLIDQVVSALIQAHPYEEPAYHYWAIETSRP